MPDESGMLVFPFEIDLELPLGRSIMRGILDALNDQPAAFIPPAPPVVAPVSNDNAALVARIGFLEAERKEFVAQIDGQATEIRRLMDAAERAAGALDVAKRAAALADAKHQEYAGDAQKRLDAALEGLRAANAKIESLEKLLAAPPVPAESMQAAPIEEAVAPEIEGGDDPDFEEVEEKTANYTDPSRWSASQRYAFAKAVINDGSKKAGAQFGITADQLRQVWNEMLPIKGLTEQQNLLIKLKIEAEKEAKS